jgi:hypothetical protein
MGVLFFNWYGYQLLSSYLQDRANRQLEARLDSNGYDESQLISLKVPSTHLSYYNSSAVFERVDGQIEIGGVQYQYVKRRLFNDSVELLCIPNRAAMHLQTAKNEFFKQVNDLQQRGGQGKKSGAHPENSKSSSIDYYATGTFFVPDGHRSFTKVPQSLQPVPVIASSYIFTAEQPPDSFTHC